MLGVGTPGHQLTTAVCMDTWIARHKHWKSYCFLFAECGFPVKTTINCNLSRNFLRRRFGSIATLLVLASLLWVNGSFVVFFAANTLQWIANVLHSWWGKWFESLGTRKGTWRIDWEVYLEGELVSLQPCWFQNNCFSYLKTSWAFDILIHSGKPNSVG